jgi:uncharacterized membrane protein YdjX (TVP38/TMEM64 family)
MTVEHRGTERFSQLGFGVRIGLFALLVAVIVGAVVAFGDSRILGWLAERELGFKGFYTERPVLTLAIAFVVYVAVTGLSLPGAAAMSILYGWMFGFWPALLLVSFASTSGATIAFLLSRYLLGSTIQARYGARLAAFNAAIEREGAFYLFTLRLIPQVPFFVINAVMGLTKLPTRTFWWVSQVGMLPGTCVFVLAGASAPSLKEIAVKGVTSILDWRLIGALVLLGIVPLAVKKLVAWLRSRASPSRQA